MVNRRAFLLNRFHVFAGDQRGILYRVALSGSAIAEKARYFL